jgi:CBS-domain-containing membrane protein
MYTASELMTENPFVIPSSAKVSEAVRALQNLEIRHLPVVDSTGALIGMLSDRDLSSLSIPTYVDGEWMGTIRVALDATVDTLMNSDVKSVGVETTADEIVDLLLQERIGAVTVLDAEGRLAGIVSYVDLLRKLALDTRAGQENDFDGEEG